MDKPKKLKAVNWDATRFSMENRPKTMATKPMSQVPGKDLPSKLNAAVEKAKSYNVPFGEGSKSKSANDNATRYRVPPATVSKPSTSTPKGQNVPMGSGSKSKEYKSFDDMPRMKMKSSSKYKSEK